MAGAIGIGGDLHRGTAPEALTRPLIILVGHSGSGKSEVAVNLALAYRELGRQSVLVDLDLVKPYFRSRLVRDTLTAEGVEVVVPEGELLYADIPIIAPAVMSHLALQGRPDNDAKSPVVIVDVGGNDNGARVLGSLSKFIDPKRAELLFVVNANRPLTGDVEAMADMIGFVSRGGHQRRRRPVLRLPHHPPEKGASHFAGHST